MTAPTSTQPLVVLLPGPDSRFLGGSLRERNIRVAARVGAAVVDFESLAAFGTRRALVVPPGVGINRSLFTVATADSPVWLVPDEADRPTDDVPGVLAGPANSFRGPFVRRDFAGVPQRTITRGAAHVLTSAARRRRAAWTILLATGKPTDGWVSRHCNRPISRVVSYAMLALGFKASHASVFTLGVGVVAAAIGLQPGHIPFAFTGVLFHLASVLDGVDGEMARATLTESEAGARIDSTVDQLTYITCFLGVTIGWVREGGGSAPLWTGLVAMSLVLSLMRAGRFVARYAPNASFVFVDRSVRRAARDSGRAALLAAAAAFTLLRRDVFALVFLVVALTGQRKAVPALIAFGVLIANLTFSIYKRELVQAAIAERGA